MPFDINTLPANLNGKVSLVTGGSRGIGKAIALKLASLGSDIAVNYTSNLKAAEETVAEIKKLGRKAIAVKADVSNAAQVNAAIAEVVKTFGKIDVLVNNAGVFLGALAEQETDEQYKKIIGINVDGVFYVTRAVIPHLSENSTIISISSAVTKGPFPGISIYTLSKGAVEAFTRALAVELAPRKIRVNAVSPGYTDSDMLAAGGEDLAKAGADASLFKRLGSPEDIAESVAFLAVPRSGAWVTGVNITSSGGYGFSF